MSNISNPNFNMFNGLINHDELTNELNKRMQKSDGDLLSVFKESFENLQNAMSVKLGFKLLSETAKAPSQGNDRASCYDLYVDWVEIQNKPNKKDGIKLNSNKGYDYLEYFAPVYYKVGLGVALEIPEGFDVKLYARSSTFKNFRSILLNSVGIIDEDYRGELMAGFVCFNESYLPKVGDRICQIQLQRKESFSLYETKELSETERGAQGFGSTGHR